MRAVVQRSSIFRLGEPSQSTSAQKLTAAARTGPFILKLWWEKVCGCTVTCVHRALCQEVVISDGKMTRLS